MRKSIGYILTIGGLIGVIFFTYKYLDNSKSFEVFGNDVMVSSGDYVPIIIAGIIMLVGVVITFAKK